MILAFFAEVFLYSTINEQPLIVSKVEASLGQTLEDDELRGVMRASGLGTEATRANIIEVLIKVGYCNREKKNIVITEKGKRVIETLRST